MADLYFFESVVEEEIVDVSQQIIGIGRCEVIRNICVSALVAEMELLKLL